jgi:predicted HNH restriction endonuclease
MASKFTLEDMKQMTHKKYRTTTYWRKFSKSLLNTPECHCEICGLERWQYYKIGKNKGMPKKPRQIHVHHKHYRNIGEEERANVLTLCTQCHKFIHDAERMHRAKGGVYTEIYDHILENTPWEYEK